VWGWGRLKEHASTTTDVSVFIGGTAHCDGMKIKIINRLAVKERGAQVTLVNCLWLSRIYKKGKERPLRYTKKPPCF